MSIIKSVSVPISLLSSITGTVFTIGPERSTYTCSNLSDNATLTVLLLPAFLKQLIIAPYNTFLAISRNTKIRNHFC